MKLSEIEKLSLQVEKHILNFNQTMPDGYFITREVDGTLLVTREADNAQTPIKGKWLGKECLSEEDISKMFRQCRF